MIHPYVAKVGGKAQKTPALVQRYVTEANELLGDHPAIWVFSARGDWTKQMKKNYHDPSADAAKLLLTDDRDILKGHPDLVAADKENLKLARHLHYIRHHHARHPAGYAAFLVLAERQAAILGTAYLREVRPRDVTFIDYRNPAFPVLVGSGAPILHASVDMPRMNAHGHALYQLFETADGVIGGYGGIAPDGSIRLLGDSGSDEAAISLGVRYQADTTYLFTDVHGILQAHDITSTQQPRTVDQMSFAESQEGTLLDIKLPSEQALQPLITDKSGWETRLCIAHAQEPNGPHTTITRSCNDTRLKCVGGRPIERYVLASRDRGAFTQLENILDEQGIDYDLARTGYRANIGFAGKGSEAVSPDILKEMCLAHGISVEQEPSEAIVGLVGARITTTLNVSAVQDSVLGEAGIRVIRRYDYGNVSTGSVIPREALPEARTCLFRAFFEEQRLPELLVPDPDEFEL